jgi:hypothetical protein
MSPLNVSAAEPRGPRRPPSLAPRVWAGSVLLVSSLVLVGLGGCFLIGVLGVLRPELFAGAPNGQVAPRPESLSGEELGLMFTLYAFAFASFLGAVLLFLLGFRGLRLVFRLASQEGDEDGEPGPPERLETRRGSQGVIAGRG